MFVGKVLFPKRFLVYLVIVFVFALYYYLNIQSWSWYVRPAAGNVACITPEREMDDLMELAKDCHIILEKFNLQNILIYGSLWGALRYKNPLPWDNDLDIALLSEEVNRIDEKRLYDAFREKRIHIYYRVWLGTYRVTRATARGDLMVFQPANLGQMSRTGIESWMCYFNHRRFHMFPQRLFERPLPKLQFAGVNFSVPREGIEIQKHFYPNDWWIESKPRDCFDIIQQK